jgi:Ser/Thr protein kinase RdoA (MazF antagonist)
MDARRILTYLAAEGIPVSAPVLTDDQEPAAEHDGEYYTLSPRVSGNFFWVSRR